jgi:Domain of unknown function (DUF3943)
MHAMFSRPRVLSAVVLLALLIPGAGFAEEPAGRVLDWETGAGKSYVIPALELLGFVVALNQFNRHFIDSDEYGSDGDTIWKNLRTAPDFDKDPFSVNQLGHPYQGSIYYGIARSAGLSYWESLGYTLVGSFLWETGGETTPPSLNDHIATGIGGTFLGEAMFRMASLVLEGGGEQPPLWRELGAALLSPATGFNRLVFGERFRSVFPSRDPALFLRLRLGATFTTHVRNEGLPNDVKELEGMIDYSLTYGLPGKPGYRYKRPFDHFLFEFTVAPNASTVANAIENVTVRGLLLGAAYEAGADYRGVWGLFGGYEYLSPQIFRVSSTNLSLGTTAQWWLSRTVALQGTVLAGIGFGASGTVADKEERDYHYGVMPQALVWLRMIVGERAMIDASARQYIVVGTGSGGGVSSDHIGRELISRGTVGLTVRLYGPHALGLQYTVSSRESSAPGVPDRHQSIQTVSLAYNFLGHRRFGAVEWRGPE